MRATRALSRMARRGWWRDALRQAPTPQLLLWLPPAAELPQPVLPPGYGLRGLLDGDAAAWCAVLSAGGELGAWDMERLRREGEHGLMRLAQRFVTGGDRIVACAGVYDRVRCGLPAWEIGWVAVHPDHRRLGLGRVVVAAAASACRLLPPRPVFLLTDDHRVAALRTYLGLGFVPDLTAPGQARRWSELAGRLGPLGVELRETLPLA